MQSLKRLPRSVRSTLRSSIILFDLPKIVEELVYNSIDAGANKVHISVNVKSCYVRVEDNGCGITRDELVILGEKYATSKYQPMDCTEAEAGPSSTGFKGETLASLSDISLVEIRTKARGRPNAYCKIIKGSKCLFLGIDDQREAVGTSVTVRDLFYNQPVRRKHMHSSPKRVLHSVKKCVLRAGLVHPQVSFRLTDLESEEELLSTVPSSSPLILIKDGFGNEISSCLHEIFSSNQILTLSGYISGPTDTFSIKALQYLYINSRFVNKGPVHNLVNNLATRFQCPVDKSDESKSNSRKRPKKVGYPVYLLNLCCPRSSYDLSFEPSKTVAEFKELAIVLSFFEQAITNLWKEISPELLEETTGAGKSRLSLRAEDLREDKPACKRKKKLDFDSNRSSPLQKEENRLNASISPISNSNRTACCTSSPIANATKDHYKSNRDDVASFDWSGDASFQLDSCYCSDFTPVHGKNYEMANLIFEEKPSYTEYECKIDFGGDFMEGKFHKGAYYSNFGTFDSPDVRFGKLREDFSLPEASCSMDKTYNSTTPRPLKSNTVFRRCSNELSKSDCELFKKDWVLNSPIPFNTRSNGIEWDTGQINRCGSYFSGLTADKDGLFSMNWDLFTKNPRLNFGKSGTHHDFSPERNTIFDFLPNEMPFFEYKAGSPLLDSPKVKQSDCSLEQPGSHRKVHESPRDELNLRFCDRFCDSKVRSRRGHSAPPFYKGKCKFTILNGEDQSSNSADLQFKKLICKVGEAIPSKHEMHVCQPCPKPNCSEIPESNFRENSELRTEETIQSNPHTRPDEFDHIEDELTKWRTNPIQSTIGALSNSSIECNDVLNISSGLLHLSGNSLIPESIDKECLKDAHVLLQLDRKFIPVIANHTLIILDQHAADERIRLEDLRRKVLSGEGCAITYLESEEELVLPEMGFQLLQKYAEQIKKWGWLTSHSSQSSDPFTKNMSLLKRSTGVVCLVAVPCILGINLTSKDLIEFMDQLVETDGSASLPPSVLRILNIKACRGAIMFGDPLFPSECSLILEELKATSLCFQCAHGRPTTVPLLNIKSLHEELVKLEMQNRAPIKTWHGLTHHKPSIERAQMRLNAR